MGEERMNSGESALRVLIVGVYLIDKPSYIVEITSEFSGSLNVHVEQRWVALGQGDIPAVLRPITVSHSTKGEDKFVLINKVLQNGYKGFDYIVICDDDIVLPLNFLPSFLCSVERYGFALSQPARSHDSFIDHHFVEQLDGLSARQTRFVEIGPLFCVRRDAFDVLLPFDESAKMGWGLDFIWPVLIENAHLTAGIVDATSVKHSLRPPVSHYSYHETAEAMRTYLAGRQHLSKNEAFQIIDAYA
jgi:hypothetical protein